MTEDIRYIIDLVKKLSQDISYGDITRNDVDSKLDEIINELEELSQSKEEK